MARPAGIQITRRRRKDGSITYVLRIRAGGVDEHLMLGNSQHGWDETRAELARKQLLAKFELGLWTPGIPSPGNPSETEPTMRELATDWLESRKRNPAIQDRTIELNETQLRRYLLPAFGELRPSEITATKLKSYREQLHVENTQILTAAEAGRPLRDPRTGQKLRTLSNESINKTLRTLALVLDEAEDQGWIERNPARGRRSREPVERRRERGTLDVDEFSSLLEAADQLDHDHSPRTIERARLVRQLRDEGKLQWKRIADHLGVAPTTAMYLYDCDVDDDAIKCGPRRAVIATLGLAGLRVGELCALNGRDVDLAKARIHIADAKTNAGVRTVDIHPRLLSQLHTYLQRPTAATLDAPAFPTRTAGRRDRHNVLNRVLTPAVARADELRRDRGELPIRAHVTPPHSAAELHHLHDRRRLRPPLRPSAGRARRPEHDARHLRGGHAPSGPRRAPG